MPSIIAAAINSADGNALVVLRVTPGGGKTTAGSAAVAASTTKTAMMLARNTLAREHFADITAARPSRDVQRRYGILSMKNANGDPICTRSKAVGAVQDAGLAAVAHVCCRCTDQIACPIEGGVEGPRSAVSVLVTNHSLLDLAVSFAGKSGLLVVDESPPMFDHQLVTGETLIMMRKALAHYETKFSAACLPSLVLLEKVFEARARATTKTLNECLDNAATLIPMDVSWRVLAGAAQAAVGDSTNYPNARKLAAEVLKRALDNCTYPPLDPAVLSRIRGGDAKLATIIGTSSPIYAAWCQALTAAPGVAAEWDTGPGGAQVRLRISATNSTVTALSRKGPTVLLDATADIGALNHSAGGTQPTVVDVAVADGAPVERVVRYFSKGSRGRTLRGKSVQWDVVAPVLRDAFGRARAAGASTVLLVSYKALIDDLRAVRDGLKLEPELDEALALEPTRLVFGHYGAIRGANEFEGIGWNDVDAVVTLGDPWPDVGQAVAEAKLLGLDPAEMNDRGRCLAACELAQVFGRLRAPRRSRPGFLLHCGRVLPLDWHAGNARVEVRPAGRPPQPSAMSVEDLKNYVGAAGGQRALRYPRPREIRMLRPATCVRCGGPIPADTLVNWRWGIGAAHRSCQWLSEEEIAALERCS